MTSIGVKPRLLVILMNAAAERRCALGSPVPRVRSPGCLADGVAPAHPSPFVPCMRLEQVRLDGLHVEHGQRHGCARLPLHGKQNSANAHSARAPHAIRQAGLPACLPARGGLNHGLSHGVLYISLAAKTRLARALVACRVGCKHERHTTWKPCGVRAVVT